VTSAFHFSELFGILAKKHRPRFSDAIFRRFFISFLQALRRCRGHDFSVRGTQNTHTCVRQKCVREIFFRSRLHHRTLGISECRQSALTLIFRQNCLRTGLPDGLKIKICVNFGGPWNAKYRCVLAIWNILHTIDTFYGPMVCIFCGNLVYFSRFGMFSRSKSGNPVCETS
jgi:hypothetical protein